MIDREKKRSDKTEKQGRETRKNNPFWSNDINLSLDKTDFFFKIEIRLKMQMINFHLVYI